MSHGIGLCPTNQVFIFRFVGHEPMLSRRISSNDKKFVNNNSFNVNVKALTTGSYLIKIEAMNNETEPIILKFTKQ